MRYGVDYGRLLVQGDGVVDGGRDARDFELTLDLFAVLYAYGVLGVNAGVVGFYVGRSDIRGQKRSVARGYLLA